ncbi:MAG: peptidyl-prolyl cis-trans isomerase [Candidatus Cloacimonetes bacterium]|nr:peptidyl-prolyl cis-trans isomerase [Candidatus Cloacimonadota bacterium]
MNKRTVLIIAILVLAGLLAGVIPPETVLADFSGGTITVADFNKRLDDIPPMYKTRYQTYEGKAKFLNDLVTEEVFYQEALSLGFDEDPGIQDKLENQIKSTYYSEFQKDLLAEKMKFSDEELHEYFLNNLDDYPGITFEEARTMVEKAYENEKKPEFLETYEKGLLEEYDIVIQEALLDSLDFNDMSTIEPIAGEKYITSNLPELEKTIGELKDFYDGLPNQNKRPFLQKDSRLNSVKELVKMDMYYLKAVAAGYDTNTVVLETLPALKRNLMLRETYNRLVTEQIDVSEEKVREYYNTNIEKFSTKASRKIQAFGFEDEATAKQNLKAAKKAVKKENEELLNQLLEASVFEFDKGEINYIYKNNLIPKCGQDTLWCEMVWETLPGKTDPEKFSSIFESAQGYYVFFRILEDNLAVATPFEDAQVKIENEMRKDLSRQYFQDTDTQLRQKYAVRIYEDNLVEKLTAEEYFQNAENSQKKRRYKDAIYYYDQICELYPNSQDAYKALFMKGFLYSEEMNDKDMAIEIFSKVISEYPEGELHESADFMIKELKGESNILEKME